MPTIQFQVTDEQFAHLQKLSGQATGTKALQTIITEYEQLQCAFTNLYQDYQAILFSHDELCSQVQTFQRSLHLITTADAERFEQRPKQSFFNMFS